MLYLYIYKVENIMTTTNQVISLRVSSELSAKLEHLVKVTKRSKADLLLHWVEDGIALEEWQLQELEDGIKEADRGIFASNDAVETVLNKWL
jgi:predicted transcriptional regulator